MPSVAHRSTPKADELREGGQIGVTYVYLLKSRMDPTRRYIGITGNIDRRLNEHNAGKSSYSAKYSPWDLVVFVCFQDDAKAKAFEKYLKSGTGHAIAEKHFW